MARDGGSTRALRSFAAWGLALLLVAAPMAVGGMRWDVQLVASGVALVLLMLGAYARLNRGMRLPWALWVAVLLIPLGLLQLAPLSVETLVAVSPKAAELRRFTLGDLGLFDGRGHPVSLAPSATWIAVFHQVAFVAVAVLAANLDRPDRHLVAKALAYGGALVALIGLVHWGVQADRIFGLYQPRHTAKLSGYFGTFVNANTQAGYLVLCTLAALGLLAHSESDRDQRILLWAAALCGAGAMLSGSRGGHVAMLVGLLVFAALSHAREKVVEARRRRARMLSNVALLLGALGVVGALAVVPEWTALADGGDEARLSTWASASDLAREFWATGAGRGAFGSVYPVVRELQASGGVSHPENIALQLATEWGVGLAAVILLVAVVGWWHAFTGIGRKVDPVHWALVAGLAAVGIQQLVDFGFESVGLSLPVAAAFGAVLAGCQRRLGPLGTPAPAVALATLVVALALGGLLAWKGPGALSRHPTAVRAELKAAAADTLRDVSHAATQDYPADYRIALRTARQHVALRSGSLREVLRWINRAIYLYPGGGETHLFAARVLEQAGRPAQAAAEYRLAMLSMPWKERALVVEVSERLENPAHLARAITRRERTRLWLGNTLLSDGQPERARATMERILEDDPQDDEAHRARGRACLVLKDDPCVQAEAAWLVDHDDAATGNAFRALLAAKHGEPRKARAALEAGAAAGVDDPAFQRTATEVYSHLGDLPAARAAATRLWKLVGANPRSGAAALVLRGRMEAKHGEIDAAARAYEQAYALTPRPRYAAEGVRLAIRAGRHDDARRLLAKARKSAPRTPALDALAAELGAD